MKKETIFRFIKLILFFVVSIIIAFMLVYSSFNPEYITNKSLNSKLIVRMIMNIETELNEDMERFYSIKGKYPTSFLELKLLENSQFSRYLINPYDKFKKVSNEILKSDQLVLESEKWGTMMFKIQGNKVILKIKRN